MMGTTGIPYLTKVWNFQTGCLHGLDICPCSPECYGRGNYHRFKIDYTPKLHPEKLLEPLKWRKPERVGVCFTGDLFGEWVHPEQIVTIPIETLRKYSQYFININQIPLKNCVFKTINACPQHQFFFLTKNPAGYRKWGEFPDNAWLGMTICNNSQRAKSQEFARLEAKHKWLSIEPIMERIDVAQDGESLKQAGIQWVVIGGWSTVAQRKKHEIKIEWIKEIVTACDNAGIPVFLKPNLESVLIRDGGFANASVELLNCEIETGKYKLRQELPEAAGDR